MADVKLFLCIDWVVVWAEAISPMILLWGWCASLNGIKSDGEGFVIA